MMVPSPRHFVLVFLVSAAVAAGCGPKWQSADADREVYGIVAKKYERALDQERPFTIEPDREVRALLEGAPNDAGGISKVPTDLEGAELPPPLPEEGPNTVVLTAADALRLAVALARLEGRPGATRLHLRARRPGAR